MEQYEIDDMMTNLQGYLERQNINTSRFFRCLNPQHIDSNASMKYFDDCKVYCFGCGCSYDLVGVIGAVERGWIYGLFTGQKSAAGYVLEP